MTPQLLFNLALLVAVGGLLIWFPDRLTLVPLVLSKMKTGNETNADRSASSPRSRRRRQAARASKAGQPKAKVKPKGKGRAKAKSR